MLHHLDITAPDFKHRLREQTEAQVTRIRTLLAQVQDVQAPNRRPEFDIGIFGAQRAHRAAGAAAGSESETV
jgi:hypothetical protein